LESKKRTKKSQEAQKGLNSGQTTSTPTPAPSSDITSSEGISPMALRTRENGGKEVEIRQDKASNCLTGVQTDAMIIKTPKKTLENQEEQSTKGTYKQLTLPISLPPTLSLLDGLASLVKLLSSQKGGISLLRKLKLETKSLPIEGDGEQLLPSKLLRIEQPEELKHKELSTPSQQMSTLTYQKTTPESEEKQSGEKQRTLKAIILVGYSPQSQRWEVGKIFGGLSDDILQMDGLLIVTTEETAQLVELLSVSPTIKLIFSNQKSRKNSTARSKSKGQSQDSISPILSSQNFLNLLAEGQGINRYLLNGSECLQFKPEHFWEAISLVMATTIEVSGNSGVVLYQQDWHWGLLCLSKEPMEYERVLQSLTPHPTESIKSKEEQSKIEHPISILSTTVEVTVRHLLSEIPLGGELGSLHQQVKDKQSTTSQSKTTNPTWQMELWCIIAKIIASLENEQDKKRVLEAVYSLRQLEFSGLRSPSISLLKTCPDYSALMMVVTSTKQLECSPTLGMTVNGKFLIQGGFSPRIESGLSLSAILLEIVDPKYFLSEKHQQTIMDRYKRANNVDIDFEGENKIISDSGTGRTLQQLDMIPAIRVGGDVPWLIDNQSKVE